MSGLTLAGLIDRLQREADERGTDVSVPLGFGNAHSYRGYYADLAFEPKRYVTVGSMLREARAALGQTFQGYKGGDFKMGACTDCWLAKYGETGETIGPVLLELLLGHQPTLDGEREAAAL